MKHYSTTRVKIKDGLEDVFPVEVRVPQGSSLFGLYFILCLAGILGVIDKQQQDVNTKQYNLIVKGRGIKGLNWYKSTAYADDLSII